MSSNIRITRVCQHCYKEFIAKTTVTKYCGDSCAKKAYKARKRKEKIKSSNTETKKKLEAPTPIVQPKEFLTRQEACELFGISRTTLWRLIKEKKIKQANTGGKIIIRKTDLHKLFN